GPTGRLTSYEAREDFAALARDNVARYHGPAPNWTLRTADAFAGLEERDADRLVVDLAEPWRLLDAAAAALRPGAVVTAFVPTALQVKQAVDGFRQHGSFGAVESLETLVRFWHVRERSVRPGSGRAPADGKSLSMARPRLPTEKYFDEIDPQRLGKKAALAASISGACRYGRAVSPREMRPVDLVVCGSVAVGRDGARLGK